MNAPRTGISSTLDEAKITCSWCKHVVSTIHRSTPGTATVIGCNDPCCPMRVRSCETTVG